MLIDCLICVYFFFFQAEDGIRDVAVTGVQTCALPISLNASALRDPGGRVIGAIGILRDMREYEQVVRDLEKSKGELQEKILDLEKFEEVVVGRELKMIALEKELESLRTKSQG